jgi:hypothetical protein
MALNFKIIFSIEVIIVLTFANIYCIEYIILFIFARLWKFGEIIEDWGYQEEFIWRYGNLKYCDYIFIF